MKFKYILRVINLFKRTIFYIKNYGLIFTFRKGSIFIKKYFNIGINDYFLWIRINEPNSKDLRKLKRKLDLYNNKPKISIIMPVYKVKKSLLDSAILSVVNQIYSNWELCVVDDASNNDYIRELLREWEEKDNRIKVKFLTENKGISLASNEALSLATGNYVGFLDHDDVIAPFALYEVVKLLNEHPEADMIYSDEDKIDINGNRSEPFFKPNWSPDLFLSNMYTCHFAVYRKKIIDSIGGFREGFEGSQDYDLVLRFTEKTDEIFHIPKILYHWRILSSSTSYNPASKSYAFKNGLKAIEEALSRRREKGWVEEIKNYPGSYRVHYNIQNGNLISIIIPTRDKSSLLNKCIQSIFEQSTYKQYEIIVIDNRSKEPETLKIFNYWEHKEPKRFRVEALDIDFNYPKLNNFGAVRSDGNVLLFLNNDIEVITKNWLEEMLGFTIRKNVGAVGTKLLYPNNKIQHAGVILGVGGVAGHSHKYFHASDNGYFSRLLHISNYSAITGACMMVERKIYNEIGGFDENLAVAFNDVDFCLKIKNSGYYNVVLPHVMLYHHESKSRGYEDTKERKKRFNKEVDYMIERWDDELKDDPFYNPNLTLEREDFSIGLERSL